MSLPSFSSCPAKHAMPLVLISDLKIELAPDNRSKMDCNALATRVRVFLSLMLALVAISEDNLLHALLKSLLAPTTKLNAARGTASNRS